MNECINCTWKGEDSELSLKPLIGKCPNCGDNIKEIEGTESKSDNFDLNKDGKVDKKDISLAARVLRSGRKINKRGKK